MPCRCVCLPLAFSVSLFGLPAACWAQSQTVVTAGQRNAPAMPASLEAALQAIPWDVSEKGVLLSVGVCSSDRRLGWCSDLLRYPQRQAVTACRTSRRRFIGALFRRVV